MIETDREEFFVLIGDVYAFYGKDYSEFAGAVWWQAMQPFTLVAVKDALNRHCVNPDSGQFLPRPADIIRMLEGSTQDAGLVAWSKVDRAVRQVGTYRSVAFDDPLIHRTVSDMGGWLMLGTKSEEDWPFLKNEFVNRYRGYRGRSDVPEYPPVLIGICQSSNSREGFSTEPPMLIGDQAKALRVMQLGSNRPALEIGRADRQSAAYALQLVESRGAA